jgi:hypothetical protein
MTLILMAIIESSVWLSLTLAEALRLPTYPRVNQFSSRTFHIEFAKLFLPKPFPLISLVKIFPVEHSPLAVPRSRPRFLLTFRVIALTRLLEDQFSSCHVASGL